DSITITQCQEAKAFAECIAVRATITPYWQRPPRFDSCIGFILQQECSPLPGSIDVSIDIKEGPVLRVLAEALCVLGDFTRHAIELPLIHRQFAAGGGPPREANLIRGRAAARTCFARDDAHIGDRRAEDALAVCVREHSQRLTARGIPDANGVR